MTDNPQTNLRIDIKNPNHRFVIDMGSCMAAVVQTRLVLAALYGRISDPLVATELRLVEMRLADLHQMTLNLTSTARDLLDIPIGRPTASEPMPVQPDCEAKSKFMCEMVECLTAMTQTRLAIETMRDRLGRAGLTTLEVRAVEGRIVDADRMLNDLSASAPEALQARPINDVDAHSANASGAPTAVPPNDRVTVH